jgi:hypothetical protein
MPNVARTATSRSLRRSARDCMTSVAALVLVVGVWAAACRDTPRRDAVAADRANRANVPGQPLPSIGQGVPPGTTLFNTERFLAWADTALAVDHLDGLDVAQVVRGIRLLAAAAADLAGGDSVGGALVGAQVGALNRTVDRVPALSPEAGIALVRAALLSGAELLGNVQRRRFPRLGGVVDRFGEAARGLSGAPLPEQRAAVRECFIRAADVVRAMRQSLIAAAGRDGR